MTREKTIKQKKEKYVGWQKLQTIKGAQKQKKKKISRPHLAPWTWSKSCLARAGHTHTLGQLGKNRQGHDIFIMPSFLYFFLHMRWVLPFPFALPLSLAPLSSPVLSLLVAGRRSGQKLLRQTAPCRVTWAWLRPASTWAKKVLTMFYGPRAAALHVNQKVLQQAKRTGPTAAAPYAPSLSRSLHCALRVLNLYRMFSYCW